LIRLLAKRDGERLFDLVAGFAHSQILFALVELDILRRCLDAPTDLRILAAETGIAAERMEVLLGGGAALGLLERVGAGYQTARLGAAVLGVPGLPAMIRHHAVFYRDLADPVALLRGEGETELARFWPYVFGAGAASDPATAAAYSGLMAETQALIAEEALRAVPLSGVRHLMDVGGGTGAFLAAAAQTYPALGLTLFDLPAVVAGAPAQLGGAAGRVRIAPGSFRDDPLPEGADAISLIRVLYDHDDRTVAALLAKVFAALPPGGRAIVAEPMLGATRPERAGEAYYALYCLAMGTGRARSARRIGAMLEAAGFARIAFPRTRRPFIASAVTARKPG
jgi:demethylspheroidene O-methyltransferase